MVSGRIYPKAMSNMSKDVFIKDTPKTRSTLMDMEMGKKQVPLLSVRLC